IRRELEPSPPSQRTRRDESIHGAQGERSTQRTRREHSVHRELRASARLNERVAKVPSTGSSRACPRNFLGAARDARCPPTSSRTGLEHRLAPQPQSMLLLRRCAPPSPPC